MDRVSNVRTHEARFPPPLYEPVHILDDSHLFPLLRTYLMDGLSLKQKKEQ